MCQVITSNTAKQGNKLYVQYEYDDEMPHNNTQVKKVPY